MLTPFAVSTIFAIYIAASYVLVLYISPEDRPDGSYAKNRDNPTMIARRMKKISIMTAVNVIATALFLVYSGYANTIGDSFKDLGLVGDEVSIVVRQTVIDLGKFIILFIGPLLDELVFERENLIVNFVDELKTIQGIRNYIVAPITEELIYTSCLLAVYAPVAGPTARFWVWTPLFFGAAHFNHGWGLYLSAQFPVKQIVVSLIVQFTYTWVFGVLTNYMFLAQGQVYSCIVVHCFCNFMGFPSLVPSRGGKAWKIGYWVLLAAGAYSFIRII